MEERELLKQLAGLRASAIPTALATIIHTRGHCPREVGAKMLVLRDGRTFGTIGGGCGESEIRMRSLGVIDDGVPVVCVVDLLDDPALEDGAVCGGRMEIFIERI